MTTTPMGLASVPDPEVPARAQRRKYGARYKARILGEYERLESTERGVLLRREGLYSSHISKWRKQRDDGALAALAMPVGRPTAHPLEKEVAWLKRENAQLQADLTTARRVIEVQGKLSALLDHLATSSAITPLGPNGEPTR
jgi:transposase